MILSDDPTIAALQLQHEISAEEATMHFDAADFIRHFGLERYGYNRSRADCTAQLGDTTFTLKAVQHEGDTEGEGEYSHIVFSVSAEGQEDEFFMITGFYQSYCGTSWDNNVIRVKPVEVTVTQYQPV